ncbi:MAG: replication factor C large subunit, partial [Nanoarchaeota archaeon]
KPKSLKQIFGHDGSIDELKKHILKKKPVLIHGNTGIGKTATIYALCNDLDYEILEINSSNLRNKEQIDTIVKNNLQQKSLFGKEKLVLIDEIDNINATDRGGLQELIKLFEDSRYPIILIANDPWDSKFKTLRQKCKLIEFKKLSNEIVFNVINDINKKEKLKIDEKLLNKISKSSNGDLRSAIIDLELAKISNKDIDLRERKETIFNILKQIFNKREVNFNIFNSLDEDLDEILLWLEENIPKEYVDEELNKAFNSLSKADVFRGRIRRWQHYRFLVYQSLLMSAGVSLAKDKENSRFTNYQRTSRILKIWIMNMKNAKRKEFVKENSSQIHMSPKKLTKELPYMNFIKY